MTSLAQNSGRSRDGLQRALPRLFKFALALTANDELARDLLRTTCKALAMRRSRRDGNRDQLMDAFRRMYALWSAKLAEDPALQGRHPPQPRLFMARMVPGSLAGNAHFVKFIASLPAVQRAVLYLVYGEGASYDEAAEIIGLPIQGVMKHLARAHLALTHWIEHRGLNQPCDFTKAPGPAGHAAELAFEPQLEREWAA